MRQVKKEDFCIFCREVKPYSVVKKTINKRIRDKDYSFVKRNRLFRSKISRIS